ncbi:MAG: hypothetical protein ACFFG0_28800 [Candidatus Thorarchaeota archaeon]
MGVHSDLEPELGLLICPFTEICDLPKHDFLCKIPECKTCSNYFSKIKAFKSRVL